MGRAALICSIVFLGAGTAFAQEAQESVVPRATELRRISSRLARPHLLTEALSDTAATTVTTPMAGRRPVSRVVQRSNARRIGGLIGLAGGAAAAALYWMASDCRYGSDSGSAMVSHCFVPSGAMVVGGFLAGRAIGAASER
jgi:hypothetical protein